MTLIQRLDDLVGCTIVWVDQEEGTVVFWNRRRVLLRFRSVEGALVEAGSYAAAQPLVDALDARDLAKRVSYR